MRLWKCAASQLQKRIKAGVYLGKQKSFGLFASAGFTRTVLVFVRK